MVGPSWDPWKVLDASVALPSLCLAAGQHWPSKGKGMIGQISTPLGGPVGGSHSPEAPGRAHLEPVAAPAVACLIAHGWGWGRRFGCCCNNTNDNDGVPPVQAVNSLHCPPVPGCAGMRATHTNDNWVCGSHLLLCTCSVSR